MPFAVYGGRNFRILPEGVTVSDLFVSPDEAVQSGLEGARTGAEIAQTRQSIQESQQRVSSARTEELLSQARYVTQDLEAQERLRSLEQSTAVLRLEAEGLQAQRNRQVAELAQANAWYGEENTPLRNRISTLLLRGDSAALGPALIEAENAFPGIGANGDPRFASDSFAPRQAYSTLRAYQETESTVKANESLAASRPTVQQVADQSATEVQRLKAAIRADNARTVKEQLETALLPEATRDQGRLTAAQIREHNAAAAAREMDLRLEPTRIAAEIYRSSQSGGGGVSYGQPGSELGERAPQSPGAEVERIRRTIAPEERRPSEPAIVQRPKAPSPMEAPLREAYGRTPTQQEMQRMERVTEALRESQDASERLKKARQLEAGAVTAGAVGALPSEEAALHAQVGAEAARHELAEARRTALGRLAGETGASIEDAGDFGNEILRSGSLRGATTSTAESVGAVAAQEIGLPAGRSASNWIERHFEDDDIDAGALIAASFDPSLTPVAASAALDAATARQASEYADSLLPRTEAETRIQRIMDLHRARLPKREAAGKRFNTYLQAYEALNAIDGKELEMRVGDKLTAGRIVYVIDPAYRLRALGKIEG